MAIEILGMPLWAFITVATLLCLSIVVCAVIGALLVWPSVLRRRGKIDDKTPGGGGTVLLAPKAPRSSERTAVPHIDFDSVKDKPSAEEAVVPDHAASTRPDHQLLVEPPLAASASPVSSHSPEAEMDREAALAELRQTLEEARNRLVAGQPMGGTPVRGWVVPGSLRRKSSTTSAPNNRSPDQQQPPQQQVGREFLDLGPPRQPDDQARFTGGEPPPLIPPGRGDVWIPTGVRRLTQPDNTQAPFGPPVNLNPIAPSSAPHLSRGMPHRPDPDGTTMPPPWRQDPQASANAERFAPGNFPPATEFPTHAASTATTQYLSHGRSLHAGPGPLPVDTSLSTYTRSRGPVGPAAAPVLRSPLSTLQRGPPGGVTRPLGLGGFPFAPETQQLARRKLQQVTARLGLRVECWVADGDPMSPCVVVQSVVPLGPSTQLHAGDTLLSINGQSINSPESFKACTSTLSPGELLDFGVRRRNDVGSARDIQVGVVVGAQVSKEDHEALLRVVSGRGRPGDAERVNGIDTSSPDALSWGYASWTEA